MNYYIELGQFIPISIILICAFLYFIGYMLYIKIRTKILKHTCYRQITTKKEVWCKKGEEPPSTGFWRKIHY